MLHILVTNKRRSLWLRWLDKTANYARCFVEFEDPATREVLLRIDGRWASGPQPLAGDRPDTATIFVPQREILVIDESFPVDVALKYSGHTHFYAFNNRSYLGSDDDPHLPWTHKDKRLDHDHLVVEVEIWAEGFKKRSGDFVIRNPNQSLANFQIGCA